VETKKPTDGELAALKAQHAHRFPIPARFTVTGDDDADVSLPVLLGNPSGACKMPLNAPVSSAWDATVAATFKMRPDSESSAAELAADCVLFPDAVTWQAWAARWPALPDVVMLAVRRKTASSLASLVEPARETPRPSHVREALTANPGSVWRTVKPSGRAIDVVIAPPDAGLWQMFTDAMKKRDAKHGEIARDMALASMRAVFAEDSSPISADEIVSEWPGLSLLIGLTVSALAGLRADFELGEM
jgi:hypothetical protein